jgi:D-alanyl-D-alanine carboxypeptidase
MVRSEVQPQLKALFDAAKAAGHSPVVTSAYRSYEEQVATFNMWVSYEMRGSVVVTLTPAEAARRAERYSARPGHSEHQLGTVVDVNCAGCAAFADSDARNRAMWQFFEENAHLYGFVISYPRGIEALTGFKHEPWHLRYIGVDYATRLFETGYLTGNGVCLLNFLRNVAPVPE